ncbi:MAG: heme A synthase [Gammaproteobacteria bacterium]|nr:heme A synthase [Gammaproteobacteria bacterium]
MDISLQNPSLQNKHDKQVAAWLIFVAAVIFFMIILGGATRLTHSGLSMVDWNPIMGIVPPLNEEEWTQTFERYKEFPEYQKINQGMSLEEFKSIFYYEYYHRVLGRLIGLLFLVPFIFFWFRGAIRRSMLPQMVTMFILGGMQGLLGWYMVKSGLVKDPQVSQYRLTAHLLTAVMIYGYMLWVAFGLLKKPSSIAPSLLARKLYHYSMAMIALIVFMITTGGFVAGTKAGYAYNTFPLMAGKFIPDGMYTLEPFWLNWFENITAIQFNHRMIAYLLVLIIPFFSFAVRRLAITSRSMIAAHLLLAMLVIQISLGVATLLLNMPVAIAVLHQGGAIVLFTIALYISRDIKQENQAF